MSKLVLLGESARKSLLAGIDFLVDPVALTEGPRGRNCLMGQRALGQSPKVTRDGVTVCNYVDPSDSIQQIGADLIREACQKTDNVVGDGTTATAVLARAMIHRGFELIAEGANPMAMERGIRKATEAVIERVRQSAKPVDDDDVFRVATVSAHGDESIGRMVADAVKKAGKDGVLTAEPSVTSETFIQSVAGLEIDKSNLLHSAFITNPETMTAEWDECRILLWEGVIGAAKSLVPLLSQVKEAAERKSVVPLLIIAGGYEQEALAVIIKARINIALPVIAVRLEAYGESRKNLLRDIAALTGGKAYTEDMGTKIESVRLVDLGLARKVVTDMRKTQIIEGYGNQAELAGRVDEIRKAIEATSGAEKVALKRRLAALLGGITIIKVGGTTVTEMEEKKDRVVDAMSAAKAALDAGVVPGGGMSLLRARGHALDALYGEEQAGWAVVYKGCESVIRQIAENAGEPADIILDKVKTMGFSEGYNAQTGKFEDLVVSGILDPASVIIESLKNASAVACSILTMGAIVAEKTTERANG